jgi:hypothetical protein
VFRNASHGEINVVYRRDDGNIGWIDPAGRPLGPGSEAIVHRKMRASGGTPAHKKKRPGNSAPARMATKRARKRR